jgi:hypothetical protein
LDQTIGFHYDGGALSDILTAGKFWILGRAVVSDAGSKPAALDAVQVGYGIWCCIP